MPEYYQRENPMATTFPHGEAFALAAWGTQRNQHEKIAMQDAFHLARRHSSGALIRLPSAQSIADREVWRDEDGSLQTPRVERIQMVLDGNSAGCRDSEQAKTFAKLQQLAEASFSQKYFAKRSSHASANYVTEIGSSLPNRPLIVVPKKSLTIAAIHGTFGERPFKCPLCAHRSPTPKALTAHYKGIHKHDSVGEVEPTRDPNHIRQLQSAGFLSTPEAASRREKRRRVSSEEGDAPPAQKIKAEDSDGAIIISDDED
ncbi:hypothetical protein SBOR_3304 [Sclerotinia borealis F-4128]|uniref:C2H2-type domain-containing protein n=1 Tax=Sclerotinia borealis (strain F-4128) TaxID=1432307 RepID=W9CKG1_SCLBF|nr:hypothetical protein SBOR_3304 [Sclerotinia borealis F-4128]